MRRFTLAEQIWLTIAGIAEKVALGYLVPISRLHLPWLELSVTFW